MGKGWDSSMLKRLKALVGKGLSASEIGKKLEVSKNAVIGKLNRLGWNVKANESGGQKSAKPKAEAKSVSKTGVKKIGASTLFNKGGKKDTTKKTVSGKVTTKTVKPVTEVKKTKISVDKPVIKTASKKTQKDLALHELLIQHALQMANLKPNQCRWPIGDPDSDNFHFCGETVFAGKPYCYEHCRQAYQFTSPKKK